MSKYHIIKVRNINTGELGYMATYGKPEFGGPRTSVFATYNAAISADVSDDTGPDVLHRHCDAWQYWERA